MSQHSNILCLIYADLPHPLNHAKLAVTHEFMLIFIQHTVKSLTHTLSLDEIQHRQLPSICIYNRHQFFRQLFDRWSQCVQDQLSPAFD